MICKSQTSLNLTLTIEKLKKLDDFVWYDDLLSRDPLYKKMNNQEKKYFIQQSIDCAEEQFEKWIQGNNLTPEDAVSCEAITIVKDETPIMEQFLYLAVFNAKPPTINLSQQAITKVEKVIQDNQLMSILQDVNLRQLILAHEFYHYIESREQIFTTKAHLESKALGVFRRQLCVRKTSEVAAVHFSKRWLGLSYCPAIIEMLLIHSIDTVRANTLAFELQKKGGEI